jgi:hypothetical protein
MRFREHRVHARSTLSVLAAGLTALALALPAPAAAASLTAHLQAPNHSPVVGKKWYITVTVTDNGKKIGGSVRYEFLFAGMVVSTQPGHSFKAGVYHDWLLFPKKSVGYPLTLRVVVKTSDGTANLDWKVNVKA